jgi:glycosyltransferase involved in cell wall biosynthesis
MGVLHQTWKDFEFLIADDGSTDDTWSCLENWAQRDRRIQLLRRKQSMGVIDSYNALFCKARGDYLWSVATDDHCINENFLQEGFEMLKRYPQAAGFYSAMNVVKMPGEIFDKKWTAGNRNRYLSPDKIMRLFWRDEGYPCGPSVVLKKTWYERFCGWPKEVGPQCDCFLNVLAGGNSGMVYLHRPSVTHRIWPAGVSFLSSQTEKNLITNLANLERLLKAHLPKNAADPNQWNRWRTQALLRAIKFEHSLRQLRKKGLTRVLSPGGRQLYRELYRAVNLFNSTYPMRTNSRKTKALGLLVRAVWKKGFTMNPRRFFTRFCKSIKKRFFRV